MDKIDKLINENDNLLSPLLSQEAIDVYIRLFWLIIKIIFTFLGVVAFCITTQVIDFDIKKVVNKLRRKTPKEIEYEKLSNKLNELKDELSKMSEMDEFANYHRKRRVILKLEDQVNALGIETQKNKMFESMKLLLVCKFLIFFMGIFFSYYTRDVIVGHIPGNYVHPFGFVLTWPWIFSEYDQHGNIPLTLFNLLMMISVVNSAYQRQSKRWLENIKKKNN